MRTRFTAIPLTLLILALSVPIACDSAGRGPNVRHPDRQGAYFISDQGAGYDSAEGVYDPNADQALPEEQAIAEEMAFQAQAESIDDGYRQRMFESQELSAADIQRYTIAGIALIEAINDEDEQALEALFDPMFWRQTDQSNRDLWRGMFAEQVDAAGLIAKAYEPRRKPTRAGRMTLGVDPDGAAMPIVFENGDLQGVLTLRLNDVDKIANASAYFVRARIRGSIVRGEEPVWTLGDVE